MTEDRSLDEFFGDAEGDDPETDDGEPSASAEGEAATEAEAETKTETETDVTPAVPTYEWSPAGRACAACGETVRRRWRAEESGDTRMICRECKSW